MFLATRALILCLVFLLGACSGKSPLPASPEQQQENVIILVPGFKGTALLNENDETVWITTGEALFGSSSLAVANDQLGIVNQRLHAGNVLQQVSIFPGLSSRDVYGTFLSRLHEDFPASKVIQFGYDWRQDIVTHVKALAALIQEERSHGAKAISLIGHSLGGLIVMHYLRYGPQDAEAAAETWEGSEKVERVVIAGAPFLGALDMFHDMQSGDTTGGNSSLLSAQALSSFPSSYQLLPALPEGPVEGHALDIFNVELWEQNGWGLFNHPRASTMAAARSFTAGELLKARRLLSLRHSSLSMPARTTIPLKVLNIIGEGRETPAQLKWDEDYQKVDFDQTTSEDGDSVVSVRSASLPYAYGIALDSQTIEISASHAELLSDKVAYQALKNLIKSASPMP